MPQINVEKDQELCRRQLLYVLLFLSGFAGLGYEIVWTRMLSAVLGHEIVSVLAVLAAFFAGLALGAWSLDRTISRSRFPGRWYAALEAAIGLWALVMATVLPWTADTAYRLFGPEPTALRQWAVAFLFPFILLLPATLSMGATLPAMERLFSRLRRSGRTVGGLYAANTFGAVAGTVAAAFIIIPKLGFTKSQLILAAVNFFCAAGALYGAARGEERRRPVGASIADRPSALRLYVALFVTGLLGIGFEVVVIRMLSQLLENTVYSFTGILAVYLLGTAVGAAVYQSRRPSGRFRQVLARLLQGLSLACLFGVFSLSYMEPLHRGLKAVVPIGITGALLIEFLLAAAVFFPPTVMMGMTFSHLAQGARRKAGGFGSALGVNTIGAALAPFHFGVLLLPAVGSKFVLVVISMGYLMLMPPLPWQQLLPAAASAVLGGLLLFGPFSLQFVTPPPGGSVIAHKEGVMAAVSVVADASGEFQLKVNNHYQMGGTASVYSDRRQAHIPLLLHPDPSRALFLGLGTGATLAAAVDHPGLEAVGVELLPEILSLLPHFEKATGRLRDHPRVRIKIADARRYIHTDDHSYDVIVADLFHPARDGAGFLYAVEHFAAARSRLNPGGLFCQWLPLYQMDLDVLRTIVRSFLEVFPEGDAFLATYSIQTPMVGLIAGVEPIGFSPDAIEKRLSKNGLKQRLRPFRLHDFFSLFGGFIAGPDDLADFAGNGPLNTDDHPVVIFEAPRFAYSQNEPAYNRLFVLLDQLDPDPKKIISIEDHPNGDRTGERLSAYWRARDKFLHVGVDVERTADVAEMLRQVRAPLLSVVRESADFEAAYLPLIAMAQRLYPIDPEASEGLLIELEKANSQRMEARQVREYLTR